MKIKSKQKFLINGLSNLIIFAILVSMFFITIFPNSQTVFSNNNPTAIYNGNREDNKVSLMFNVYWGTEYISDILNVLNSLGSCKIFKRLMESLDCFVLSISSNK